jgi:NAD(P)-dependent dehydrogenase (short-subunit alcohol dehydrogenase family)
MTKNVALVTGTTSGLGYAAAKQLAASGWRQVIVTGRSTQRIADTVGQLAAETGSSAFSGVVLDLNAAASVTAAVAELARRGQPIDFLVLNAGLVGGKTRVVTDEGLEASQAPLIGHHRLVMGLLAAGLLAPGARIVIAGSEAARGDVPLFHFTDLPALAAKHHQGDRTAAVEALLRGAPHVKYDANTAYADAKVIVAWWVAALARKLPATLAVYAVSPGSAPDTQALRNGSFVMQRLMVPLMKLIPGMSQTTDEAARRYLQAAEFGVERSGEFFASAPRKVSGPVESMRHAHFHDRASQDATWAAVVKVAGVDAPTAGQQGTSV